MSRTINKLVEDKLAIRETHAENRRYVNIELTNKGQEVYQSIEIGFQFII